MRNKSKNIIPISESEWDTCVHCGICLKVCPTYKVTQNEILSPRGRVYMVKEVLSGRHHDNKELNDILQTCLDCGECTRICPNCVHPDLLVIKYRASQAAKHGVKKWEKWLLEHLFVSPEAVHSYFKISKKMMPLSFLIPLKIVGNIRNNFPDVSTQTFSQLVPPGTYEGKNKTRKDKKVFFYEGCVMGGLLAEESKASVILLQKLGFDVVTQTQESCCGALQFNRGEFQLAIKMAKKQIESIPEDVDFVVTDCAGCSGMLARYHQVFPNIFPEKAEKLAGKTRHILDLIPMDILERKTIKTAFHRPCQYNLPISKPSKVSITNQFYKSKTGCCGSAGIFSLLHKELSEKILCVLKNEILEADIEQIVISNPGCYFTFKKALSGEVKVEYISQYFLEQI